MLRLIVVSILAVSGLMPTAHSQQAPAKAASGVWRDPATQMVWANADNGVGASAAQAAYFCRNLNLNGNQDWRLPTIDELQTLFGGQSDGGGRHVVGPVHITGWVWSSTPGQQPGEQWALDFGDGGRASAVTGDSGLNRALCVRGQAKR